MRPQYKFIVMDYWGTTDIYNLNRSIEEESNRILLDYNDVDIQSVVKTGDLRFTVFYKVKLEEKDELQDWGT